MKQYRRALAASALTLALVLTGCSATTQAPAETSAPAATASSSANQVDEMFVTMMIPHHQQAVEMADLMLTKTDADADVLALAEQIRAAQAPEIELMLGWLEEWGVPYSPDDDHGMGDGAGEGMMSEADMTELEEATGDEASRLFLEQMIVHHEGAVLMTDMQLENGQDPDVLELAQQMNDDQSAEILTMRQLLTEI
ncbi:DUF305 domain-containing protein [Agrococcus sp. ProA11]|uniref:DUF305 domain-containing protein n=1 Tax=Agrococcus chionoecetis TaxID=3153752 RepID=UPI003260FCA5